MRLVDRGLELARFEGWLAWVEFDKAVAEYRAGNFAACVEWLGRFRDSAATITLGDRRNLEGAALALAAMAHHRLGHEEQARQSLDEANRLMEQCPKVGEADLGEGPENRQVWEILLREARALLRPDPAPTAARGD
jgi:hypothetical protein